jgi:hypothetical protein
MIAAWVDVFCTLMSVISCSSRIFLCLLSGCCRCCHSALFIEETVSAESPPRLQANYTTRLLGNRHGFEPTGSRR